MAKYGEKDVWESDAFDQQTTAGSRIKWLTQGNPLGNDTGSSRRGIVRGSRGSDSNSVAAQWWSGLTRAYCTLVTLVAATLTALRNPHRYSCRYRSLTANISHVLRLLAIATYAFSVPGTHQGLVTFKRCNGSCATLHSRSSYLCRVVEGVVDVILV
eukprot:848720-Prorocentrum_minimum.AAC.3